MTDPTDGLDDGLRARMRAADPALGAPPSSSRWINELTEATMSTPTGTPIPVGTPDGTPDRGEQPRTSPPRWRVWAVPAAAAVAVAAVVLTVWLGRSGGPAGPIAGAPAADSPSVGTSRTASASAAPVTLRAGAPVAARCLPVSIASLRRMPTAFAGTVTLVRGTTATLQVSRWYAGTASQRAADQVQVEGMSPQLRQLVYGVDLRRGGHYLVTAVHDGQITACGFSAEVTPRLAGMYAEAFGG